PRPSRPCGDRKPRDGRPAPSGRSACEGRRAAILLLREERRSRGEEDRRTLLRGIGRVADRISGQIRRQQARRSQGITARLENHRLQSVTHGTTTTSTIVLPPHAEGGDMPTGVYVRQNAVSDRLKAGMAADHAVDFARWL
ncbi:hypothetical protein KXV85_005573, partial [Aspergillus fumigatus]